MSITYTFDQKITPALVDALYQRAGLQRPRDLDRLQRMFDNSNIVLTAWDDDRLIGIARAMCDYGFDCYLNDLAVDPDYQRQGIGQDMIRRLQAHIGDEVMLLLLAARDAVPFYQKTGFREVPGAFAIPNQK